MGDIGQSVKAAYRATNASYLMTDEHLSGGAILFEDFGYWKFWVEGDGNHDSSPVSVHSSYRRRAFLSLC